MKNKKQAFYTLYKIKNDDDLEYVTEYSSYKQALKDFQYYYKVKDIKNYISKSINSLKPIKEKKLCIIKSF